jgi:hypothetical protein
MERRPFFRVLGVASGAVLAETLGVELWDLARAMQQWRIIASLAPPVSQPPDP